MDISKIDKNFADPVIEKNNKMFDIYTIPNSKTDLYGVFYENNGFIRLPKEVAFNASEVVSRLYNQTAGGRLRFSTNSKNIKIIAKWNSRTSLNHMPATGVYGFTLQEDYKNGKNKFIGTFVPTYDSLKGYESQISLSRKKLRYFTLYFPLYNEVSELLLLVDKGAILEKGLSYNDFKPIVYYGSSITQGGCASRPDNSYQSIITKKYNLDYINLGFSGGCRAEESLVKYMAGLDASVFVCDYDHNAPTVEYLQNTHYKLYKTYRSINPNTHILFISRPSYYIKTTMNPKARLKIIKETYEKAISEGDKNVYFLDGRKLFKREYNLCTVDGIHPNDLGFYFMAKAIGNEIVKILGVTNKS